MSLPLIKLTVTNRHTTFHVSPETQIKLKKFFRFHPLNYEFREAYRCGAWDGYTNLLQRGRVATGLFFEKKQELEKKYRLDIDDQRKHPAFIAPTLVSNTIRPYQTEAVNQMMEASVTGGLIVAATGVGKTRLAGLFFKYLKGSAVFICDELALLMQSKKAFEKFLVEKVGIVGKSIFDPRRITVATIQTLQKHKDKKEFINWFKSLEVVVIDEIDIAINKRNIDVVNRIRPKAVFGLTATLELKQDYVRIPVIALAGPVIFTYPIEEAVEDGYLSRGVIGEVAFANTLHGVAPGYWTYKKNRRIWIPAGSPSADYRYRISLNKSRNDCIEALIREGIHRGHRIVVLAERKVHLRVLGNRVKDLPCAVLSGANESSERLQAMKMMDSGKLPLIIASRVLSRGVDVVSISLIIDATALPGRNSAIQRYGRGTRKTAGKQGILYIDIADVGNRFEETAKLRAEALRETGSQIINFAWKTDSVSDIFATLERVLVGKN